MSKPQAQNIVLGAGHIYFDIEDANGNLTGERYIGDTPGFSLNVESENLQTYSSDGPIAELLSDVATQVSRTTNITCRNISTSNLAMFLIGDESEVSQNSDPVVDEAINGVQQGRWYQLGQTTSDPTGARDVSNVVVEDDSGTPTTFVLDTDYNLDLDLGRVYIIPGGGIADDTNLVIDYDKAAVTFDQISTNNLGAKVGALRFIAANTDGANRDLYVPKITMRPSGEFAMKSRSEVQQMTFEGGVGTRDTLPQVYVNGRPA